MHLFMRVVAADTTAPVFRFVFLKYLASTSSYSPQLAFSCAAHSIFAASSAKTPASSVTFAAISGCTHYCWNCRSFVRKSGKKALTLCNRVGQRRLRVSALNPEPPQVFRKEFVGVPSDAKSKIVDFFTRQYTHYFTPGLREFLLRQVPIPLRGRSKRLLTQIIRGISS